jgi:glycine oxidase
MHDHNGASRDVVVIGGGVIGLAVAWRAAQAGVRVTVLERGRPGGETSHVAAGMLAPISEARPTERGLLALGLRSAAIYHEFVAELAGASGRDPGYLPCGTLAVARDADEAEALERELDMRRGLGLEVSRLLPSAVRRMEPALAPTLRLALEVPNDHAVDPRRLTAALVRAAQRAGVVLRAGAARSCPPKTSSSPPARGPACSRAYRPRPACPSDPSRVRSFASTIPPVPGSSDTSCAWEAATSSRAGTGATFSAPPWRSAASIGA